MKNTKVELIQVVEAVLNRLKQGANGAAANETVFQGEVSVAKCLPPPSEMVQRL